MESIKNMKSLINDLSIVYTELRNGTMDKKQAKEIVNTACKIIKGAGSQLAYNEFMKKEEPIEFFETTVIEPSPNPQN